MSLEQVKAGLTLLSWWISLMVIPLSSRLALLVCRYSALKPNCFTTCSLLLRLITAALFLLGEPVMYVAGAFSFYFACVFDAIDGPVARLTGQATEFGRYFDHVSDLVGDFLILAALAFGRGMLCSSLVVGMLFMHIAESYISYLTGIALQRRGTFCGSGKIRNSLVLVYARYRHFFFSRNLKSFFSFPDYTAATFILFPLLGSPEKGIKIGFFFLLATTLYTVFSTFISLHTDEHHFP